MPVAVFLVGCSMGTESFTMSTLLNMIVVSGGVAIASLGMCVIICEYTTWIVCASILHTHPEMVNIPQAYTHTTIHTTTHHPPHTGELHFVLTGVLLQLCSIMTESTRLTLVQILLQRKGVKLNPVSTLYYVAPCSLVFLIVPFVCFDLPEMLAAETIPVNPAVLLSNALAAFGMCWGAGEGGRGGMCVYDGLY